MLSLIGGPLDGTYAVQPRHMNVKYPRNLNDNDLGVVDDATTYPLNVPTQMSCFIQRIRLAELCRAVVDARDPGSPEVGFSTIHVPIPTCQNSLVWFQFHKVAPKIPGALDDVSQYGVRPSIFATNSVDTKRTCPCYISPHWEGALE